MALSNPTTGCTHKVISVVLVVKSRWDEKGTSQPVQGNR